MVLGALVVPLAGTASAQATGITLTPESDTATVNSCNVFTAAVPETGTPGGETVTVEITQSDTDSAQDLLVGFCDPATGLATGNSDLDDNTVPNSPVAGVAAEAPARATGSCVTAAPPSPTAGTCSFGVTSDEPGTMTVVAAVENPSPTVGDFFVDTSTKTWVADVIASIECTPETDSNPEGSAHTITCRALTAEGTPVDEVGGTPVVLTFDVTAGPNAEEVGPTDCAAVDPVTGEIECTYTDFLGPGSPPGTDTVTIHRNLPCPRAGVTACGPGAELDELQTTVTKTFVGLPRVIDCEPEEATNRTLTTHEVTCTVTDRVGNPVPDVDVFFDESGPGRFAFGGQTDEDTTDADGVATADVTASREEEGDQTITGSLDTDPALVDECERAADDPAGEGAVAGVCSDDVTKTWRPRKRRAESSVTIRGSFKGQVISEATLCKRDRKVLLKKKRPGPNPTVGKDRTNNRGNWRINKQNPNGKYYAKINRNKNCKGDRSPTVRK